MHRNVTQPWQRLLYQKVDDPVYKRARAQPVRVRQKQLVVPNHRAGAKGTENSMQKFLGERVEQSVPPLKVRPPKKRVKVRYVVCPVLQKEVAKKSAGLKIAFPQRNISFGESLPEDGLKEVVL